MANDMKDALLSAGFKPESKDDINEGYELPFKKPSCYSDQHDLYSFYDHVKMIKNEWFIVEESDIASHVCTKGEKIKKLLIRNIDKLKVVQNGNAQDNWFFVTPQILNCLEFWFEYHVTTKEFSVCVNRKNFISPICLDHNIPVPPSYVDFRNLPIGEWEEHAGFYLTKYAKEILLIEYPKRSVIYYPDHAFTFEEIQEDQFAMNRLEDYLSKAKYKPNPKTKYYINYTDPFFGIYGSAGYHYFLTRADKEVK